MKKLIFLALLIFSGTLAAQSSFGIKGGLNYGATGDYDNIPEGMGEVPTSIQGDDKIGYHFGFFANFELLGIFLQPELLYTRLNTDYNQFEYNIDKIDLPVLLGLKVLGPLNIKAGPSLQYILSNELEDSELQLSNVENEITLGYQLGAGLNIGNLEFDLRFEGAFSDNNAFGQMAEDQGFKIDSRPSQWILSAGYRFN